MGYHLFASTYLVLYDQAIYRTICLLMENFCKHVIKKKKLFVETYLKCLFDTLIICM